MFHLKNPFVQTENEFSAVEIIGNKLGKTVLITAGMDGDEYAGMEAAYTIIEKYKNKNFSGRLIVIPILNLPGFKAECSQNPTDGIFPKHVFPGKAHGTPTERLIYRLATGYAYQADAWLDLHGGALTESVAPFIWAFETGAAAVDDLSRRFYLTSGARTVVVEKAHRTSRAGVMAAHSCMYALLESGGRGGRAALDIDRHVRWVEALLQELDILPDTQQTPEHKDQHILHTIEYIYAPHDGIIRQTHQGDKVRAGELLGIACRVDGTHAREIYAPKSGFMLWRKETMTMRRGDTLWAIGY